MVGDGVAEHAQAWMLEGEGQFTNRGCWFESHCDIDLQAASHFYNTFHQMFLLTTNPTQSWLIDSINKQPEVADRFRFHCGVGSCVTLVMSALQLSNFDACLA